MTKWVKIRECTVGRRGARGLVFTIPQTWARKMNVKPGDKLGAFISADIDDLRISKEVPEGPAAPEAAS